MAGSLGTVAAEGSNVSARSCYVAAT